MLEDIRESKVEKPAEKKPLSLSLKNEQEGFASHHTLRFSHLSKSVEGSQILKSCSGSVGAGQKVILLGSNGAGKSTLLNILAKRVVPDTGTVEYSPSLKVGYLTQGQGDLNSSLTLMEELNEAFCLSHESLRYKVEVSWPFFLPVLDTEVSRLSIGQQRLLQLAKITALEPDILLLDEPTNHLDYSNAEYLEEQLLKYRGAILIVSHDRWFIRKMNVMEMWKLENGHLATLAQSASKAYRVSNPPLK